MFGHQWQRQNLSTDVRHGCVVASANNETDDYHHNVRSSGIRLAGRTGKIFRGAAAEQNRRQGGAETHNIRTATLRLACFSFLKAALPRWRLFIIV